MSEHGGKGAGAGRPSGSLNRATVDQKARLSELARQHAGPVLEALAQVALWNPLTSSLEPLEASY